MTDVFMKLGSLLRDVSQLFCAVHRRRGVMERAFIYLLFQLTKNADSYGIVL